MNIDPEELAEIVGADGSLQEGEGASNVGSISQSHHGSRRESLLTQAADAVLMHLLGTLNGQLKARAAALWLLKEGAGGPLFKSRLQCEPAFSRPFAESWADACLPYELVRAAVRTRLPAVCDDVAEDPRIAPDRPRLLACGVRTVMVVPLVLAGRAVGIICVYGIKARSYGPNETELAQALAQQATLTIQITRLAGRMRRAAVMEERRRLALELHDTVGQGFTGIIVQLEAAQEAMRHSNEKLHAHVAPPCGVALQEVQGHLRRASTLARQSLDEARRTLHALHSRTQVKGSLCAAMEQLLREMTAGTGVRAELRLEGQERPLLAEREKHLLRISQEALTNTLRHARADRFEARLAFAPDEIRLDLRDNGCGFDPHDVSAGFGLKGMRERAEKIGARLIVWSLARVGTGVCVALPDNPVPAVIGG